MKLFQKIILLTCVTLIGLGAYFFQDLRELYSLHKYSRVFISGNIDKNFRTMYEKFPSKKIDGPSEVYTLSEKFDENALPETFVTADGEQNLKSFFDSVQTTGLIVMQGDDVVYEKYDRGNSRDTLAIQMSVSKSFASTLIGIAIDEGLIDDVNDPLTKYAPQLIGTAYDGVTIKNALEMSTGVAWSEDIGDINSGLVQSIVAVNMKSIDVFTASVPREKEPGTYNRYTSIDTQTLGMVIQGATGQSYETYFKDKIWDKIGAEGDAYMLQDAIGAPVVYGGLNMRLRDMLRFGKVMRDGGVNHLGERVVSVDWIKEATTPDVPRLMPMLDNPESDTGFGYKYQWWIPFYPDGDDYSAIGIYGQFIYVNPRRNIVIAKTTAYADYPKFGGEKNHETLLAFQAIARHLSPMDGDKNQ